MSTSIFMGWRFSTTKAPSALLLQIPGWMWNMVQNFRSFFASKSQLPQFMITQKGVLLTPILTQ
jgi:hypothetical protein